MRGRTTLSVATLLAAGALIGWLATTSRLPELAHAQDKQPADPKAKASAPKQATEHTKKRNTEFAKGLPFKDTRDFDNAKKGRIAELPEGGVVKNAEGTVIWDPRTYDFIKSDEPAPDTINPSLWRQAQLLSVSGLFKVTDQIYQIRGYDLSNITFIEGKDGVTVMDPLVSQETAKA